jgi:hypothetical protein
VLPGTLAYCLVRIDCKEQVVTTTPPLSAKPLERARCDRTETTLGEARSTRSARETERTWSGFGAVSDMEVSSSTQSADKRCAFLLPGWAGPARRRTDAHVRASHRSRSRHQFDQKMLAGEVWEHQRADFRNGSSTRIAPGVAMRSSASTA